MTKSQARIVELITKLSVSERRELVEHVRQIGLLDESYCARMTPEQLAQLDDGIAQADRGEVVDANEAFDRLSVRFGYKRA